MFASLRLNSGNEYVRCLLDVEYCPKIIHWSGWPKPSDILFGEASGGCRRAVFVEGQNRPPCVQWVGTLESEYQNRVILPQMQRHDEHLKKQRDDDDIRRFVKCQRCGYPCWKDKDHPVSSCQDNLYRKQRWGDMRTLQKNYDKMATRQQVEFLYEVVWPSMVWALLQMLFKSTTDGSCPGFWFRINCCVVCIYLDVVYCEFWRFD